MRFWLQPDDTRQLALGLYEGGLGRLMRLDGPTDRCVRVVAKLTKTRPTSTGSVAAQRQRLLWTTCKKRTQLASLQLIASIIAPVLEPRRPSRQSNRNLELRVVGHSFLPYRRLDPFRAWAIEQLSRCLCPLSRCSI